MKPYPDPLLHAAEAMGFAPSDCLVVEDSQPGVLAGVAAGMRVFAYLPEEEAPAWMPEGVTVIRELRELRPLLCAELA